MPDRNTPKFDRSNVDHRLIADRLLCRRDTLRTLPGDLFAASELARQMITERELFEPEDLTPYNNNRSLDALIAVSGAAALYLSGTLYDIVGEDDDDLPTITPPAPRPAEPAPTVEEMRATWQKVADHAAEQLAALDAADQGEAVSSNGGAA